MGVRGLLKLLRTKVKPEVRKLEEDDHGDREVLMVDFQPFCFWILETSEDEVSSWDFRDVSRRAETFVRRLGRCGVAAQFVDDGARGSGGVAEMESKVQEWQSRAKQSLESVKNLKAFLEGSGIEPKEKQRCGFFTLAVHHGLQAAGAPVQLADGEADPVLAAELMKPRTIGILGNDTDFVLMKHGRFIHFEELKATDWLAPDADGPLTLPIWSRRQLAASLKVSEEVLPMAAALCGNDHSKPIIEECRRKGLPGPDGEGQLTDQFASLAALLQTALEDGRNPEETALELLSPALSAHADYNRACKVLVEVQSFYAPGSAPKPQLKWQLQTSNVRKEVLNGQLPKWCWPLAAYGVYYVPRTLEDPGLGSCATSLLLQLKQPAFGLLAPEPPQLSDRGAASNRRITRAMVKVRLLGAGSDHKMFQDEEKLCKKEGDLGTLRRWDPKLRKKWLQDAVEGPECANRPWEAKLLTVRELHLFSLRFLLRWARKLKITEVEFEALMSIAWLLVAGRPWSQHAVSERPSWRCVSLGSFYQAVLGAILDLAKLMHVAPNPWAQELFHGPLWQSVLSYFHAHGTDRPGEGARLRQVRRQGKMGPRTWIDGDAGDAAPEAPSLEEDLERMRCSSGYRAWRDEVMSGLDVNELHASAATLDAEVTEPMATNSSALPIEAHKDKLCYELMTNRVVCVQGETGSGKSTQVPQYILELFPDAQIAVTQPRRMAAVNLAKRVAKERSEELGQSVGYRIGGDSVVGKRLNFQTTGWLLRALTSDSNRLGRLTHVVFDEIHERSADADFLSLVARLLLHRFPQVNLVIMSATLQAHLFRSYFGELQVDGAQVPLVPVGGKCFEVQKVFLDNIKDFCKEGISSQTQSLVWRLSRKFEEKEDHRGQKKSFANANSQALADYASAASPLILDLLAFLAKSECTILVFLPGLQEITNIYDECQTMLHAQDGTGTGSGESSGEEAAERNIPRRTFNLKFKVFAMHSQIPMEDQLAVFQAPQEGECHFVLASNVAESSLTLPNVCAVIDLGMNKQQVYDHRLKMTYLALKWTSRASAHQRSGRAGRTMPGVVVRLYPQRFYDAELQEFDRPETAVLPLPRLYLQAKQLAKELAQTSDDGDDVDAEAVSNACSVLRGLVDPPDLTIIEASRRELAEGWALEKPLEEAEMTSIGRVCLSLPFDLSLSRLVWLSIQWGCVADGVILACSLAVPDPFSAPSLFAFPDLVDLGPRLRRSNATRRHFDNGMASQPLTAWRLFQEFWRTFPTDSKRDGRKGWLKHAHHMASPAGGDHAVIPRRLTEFVAQVDEVAQRLVAIVKEGSEGQKKLYRLLAGLGRRSLDTLGTEFTDDANWHGPTPWDKAEEEQMAATAESKAEREERVKIQKQKLGKTFETEVDVLRALLAASFSERLLTTARKPVEAKRAAKDFRRLAEMSEDVTRSVVLRLPEVPDFPGGMEKLVQLMMATERPVKLLGLWGEDQLCVQIEGHPEGEGEEGIMPNDLDPELHVLNQLTRGKGQSCQLDLAKLQKNHGATVAEPKVLQFDVQRPAHPCQLTWEVHATAEDDQKGRASSVRKGIPDAHSPIGFICHVPKPLPPAEDAEDTDRPRLEEEQLEQLDMAWYGCCGQVQYTAGQICFISGLTLLHPQHLKFLLLTADPQQTSLAFQLTDSLGAKGLKLHRKEIPVNISAEELQLIDRFREDLRNAMADGGQRLCESWMAPELHRFCTCDYGAPVERGIQSGPRTSNRWSRGMWTQPPLPDPNDGLPGMQPLMPKRKDSKVESVEIVLRTHLRKKKDTTTKALWKVLKLEHLWTNESKAAMEEILKSHSDLFLRDEKKQWRMVPS